MCKNRISRRTASKFEFFYENPLYLGLGIGYPSWCKTGIRILINCKEKKVKQNPGAFVVLNRKYSVYLDLFNEDAWREREKEYKAEIERIKKMRLATIDFVQPGEMQPERNHNFKGERTTPGRFKERPNRESMNGWFSSDMKTDPGSKSALVVEYWGGFPGAKTFDILINDKIVAKENIALIKEGQFINIEYDIPEDIVRGRSQVAVKFIAHPGNMAGPVFGVRTIKK